MFWPVLAAIARAMDTASSNPTSATASAAWASARIVSTDSAGISKPGSTVRSDPMVSTGCPPRVASTPASVPAANATR